MTRKPMIRTTLALAAIAGVLALTLHTTAHEPPHEASHAEHGHAEKGHGETSHEEHADEVKLSEAAVRQNNVRVAPAETGNLAASFTAPARVAFNADAMAHVGSAASGRVVDLKARVGDRVRASDELLVVESAEFGRAQSDYLQRRVEADVAAAAVAPLKDAYDRAKKLFDDAQGIALPELQKREADYRAAVGEAATSKAALNAAENGLRLYGLEAPGIQALADSGRIDPRFHVRSPVGGTVIERQVALGQWVSPEKDRLLVVADTQAQWVLADVPEARLADVGVGSRVEVQLAALPAEHVAGEVSFVAPQIDPHTRTAQLRIVIPNPTGTVRPGMFAKVLLQGRGAAGSSVVVPEEAVQTVEGKASVFVPVEGEPNTFAPRPVVAGKPVDGFVALSSGLKAGEPVVVSGAFILKAELGKSEAGHEH